MGTECVLGPTIICLIFRNLCSVLASLFSNLNPILKCPDFTSMWQFFGMQITKGNWRKEVGCDLGRVRIYPPPLVLPDSEVGRYEPGYRS